jgi:transposase-like protein
MPKLIDDAVKARAIQLRVERQLGLQAIAQELGVAKSTLSLLLRPYPLPRRVVRERGAEANRARARPQRPPSRFARELDAATPPLDTYERATVALLMVQERLARLGVTFEPRRDAQDFEIRVRPRRGRADEPAIRVEVRVAYWPETGRPRVDVYDRTQEVRLDEAKKTIAVAAADLRHECVYVVLLGQTEVERSVALADGQLEAWGTLGMVPAGLISGEKPFRSLMRAAQTAVRQRVRRAMVIAAGDRNRLREA